MKMMNYTPFPHLQFQSLTPDGQRMGVMVLRGTFAIVRGQPLRPIPVQDPVALRDHYCGEPSASSLIYEADIAPLKPKSDITLNAVAHSPNGKLHRDWHVNVRIGSLTKGLVAQGPSAWQHFAIRGWKKTQAIPCREVPVIYERAYGGQYPMGDGSILSEERNPIGTGWIDSRVTPRDREIPAPQIIAPGEPDHEPGKRYVPQGFLPIPAHWESRRLRAGRFDKAWRDTQWPLLPRDFDYAFYNNAHPSLIYPGYLSGSEVVELQGLSTHSQAIVFQLPGYRLAGLQRCRSGEMRPFMCVLDTVHIDIASSNTAEHRVHLVWRGSFRLRGDERQLEARMDRGDSAKPFFIPIVYVA